jgi:3-oxosteroid 1-dehydrogenase
VSSEVATDFDVIVLGTGAAGMTAALAASVAGAKVGLFERAPTVGGTTAVSGGVTWIPWHQLPVDGEPLTRADAKRYFDSVSLGYIDENLINTFIDTGQPMLDFVHRNSRLRFTVDAGSPDYYPENPGGRPEGGRSLNPSPFPYSELGEWATKVTRYPPDLFTLGIDAETRQRRRMGLSEAALEDLERTDSRFMGAGLIGALLAALLERGVVPHTEHRAVELTSTSGAVAGVVFDTTNGRIEVSAQNVVVATGGFEWDPTLVKAFLHGPMTGPVSPPFNEGDGLRMMMLAGARLWNMGDAWWAPVVHIPDDEWRDRPRYRTVRFERTRPRSILVNRHGERFVNEASNYNSLGKTMQAFDPSTFGFRNVPAWLVIDDVHFQTYGFMGVAPGTPPPDWFNRSDSVGQLAARVGIDPEGLHRTLQTWNEAVKEFADPQFHRGESAHDGWWGDPTKDTVAERTLGPIDTSPFYAVPIGLGCLGTKGGPLVNTDGQVLHLSGAPIAGLYAAGNAMSAVSGQAYGGAGGTIGPAMVWGYRAGTHAASGRPATTD